MDTNPIAALRALPLFETAGDPALERLASTATRWAVAKGTQVCRQGDPADVMFVVLSGRLAATWTDAAGNTSLLRTLGPGDPIGEVPAIIGGARTATVSADTASELLVLPRAALDDLIASAPSVLARLTTLVRRRQNRSQLAAILTEWLGELDEGLVEDLDRRGTILRVRRGESPIRQGDTGDAWFLVLNGRFRVTVSGVAGITPIGEVGRGESVGEIALLTNGNRGATLTATRDSELLRIPKPEFEALLDQWPAILKLITRNLARQLVQRTKQSTRRTQRRTWALVPASPGVDLVAFAERLGKALSPYGVVRTMGSDVLSQLGLSRERLSEDHPAWARVDFFLDQDDNAADFVLLIADEQLTPWSRITIGHAERLVLVADPAADPAPGALETALAGPDAPAPSLLVLLHPADSPGPVGTERWLTPRPQVSHQHVRVGHVADFGRLGRTLAGQQVGLALGGGGARGFAHIGVIRAFRERGIPIDTIGGTSMGSIIAGQCALGFDFDEMIRNSKEVIAQNGHREYTLPLISILRSKKADVAAKHTFGDKRIEDLWTPFFAVSCDMTSAAMVIDDRGPAWEATRASGSIPGVFAPVTRGNALLVDGGLMNNLPADILRQRCEGTVIAVHVSGASDLTAPSAGLPSPWQMLWQQLLPIQGGAATPTIVDILMRSMLVGSVGRTQLSLQEADVALVPPVGEFGTMAFEKIEKIAEAGYRYTLEQIDAVERLQLLVQRG